MAVTTNQGDEIASLSSTLPKGGNSGAAQSAKQKLRATSALSGTRKPLWRSPSGGVRTVGNDAKASSASGGATSAEPNAKIPQAAAEEVAVKAGDSMDTGIGEATANVSHDDSQAGPGTKQSDNAANGDEAVENEEKIEEAAEGDGTGAALEGDAAATAAAEGEAELAAGEEGEEPPPEEAGGLEGPGDDDQQAGEQNDKSVLKAKKFVATKRDFEIQGPEMESGLEEGDKHAGQLTAEEWQDVIENCGVMYGWIVDRRHNRILRAPRPAFKLSRPAKKESSDEGAEGAEEAEEAFFKPSFRVNDDSHIEIIMSSHEFETSMATNDFSSQSTEGSVSGGYAGFSATVSAGYSSSKSASTASSSNQYQKTLIAKYLFPRADIYLHPNTLELSDELKEAIAEVTRTGNIKDLRKLQAAFGHLVCRQVTLGGRLLSTKIMSETTNSTEQEQKESFKTSMGVAVSTPYGGASVKRENEEAKSSSSATTNIMKSESLVFEAVGGDTILAANPEKWAPTVGNYQNWRVISRDSLTPLADAISQLEGGKGVKSLFAKALPVLNEYIEIPETRELKVRLRLTDPTTQLSLSHIVRQDRDQLFEDPMYYFGYEPLANVSPRLLALKDPKDEWGPLIETDNDTPLFNPRSYRAPAIHGYVSNKVGDAMFGSSYNQEYVNTMWSITTPFDDALCHGTQVIIRTVPFENSSNPLTVDSAPPPQAASLAVFRNQQGVFLPCMSDGPEEQIWRILKIGASKSRENIKEGDNIRLAWAFADQRVGFRDFVDDVFGRRRNSAPPGMERVVLYPKLPWPRFESLTPRTSGEPCKPNALVMSHETEPRIKTTFKTLFAAYNKIMDGYTAYGLQDLSFRIDLVGNEGRGDVHDYLLRGLNQREGLVELGDSFNSFKPTSERRQVPGVDRFLYGQFFLESPA